MSVLGSNNELQALRDQVSKLQVEAADREEKLASARAISDERAEKIRALEARIAELESPRSRH